MNHFKLGTNFDMNLLDGIVELNQKYEGKAVINEVYGSERKMAFLTARPDFRLPEVDREHFEAYIKRCKDLGICFNYTMNTITPGSKREIEAKKEEIIDFIHYLESIGCTRVTIANPLLMGIVREASKTIEIDVSTIMHMDTVTQIKYMHDTFNIRKVCCSLLKNRQFAFLKQAAAYCNDNDIEFEVLANEFCGVGGDGYATGCVYRDSCYISHAYDQTKEDAERLGGYPMKFCITARDMDPYNWLRVRWVRPEDLAVYNEVGIDKFKVSGRTGTTEYLLKMAEAYMSEHWEGNLLGLWKPLETIYTEESELDFEHKHFIDNGKLDGFIKKWANDPTFDCANELCGTTCTYCQDFYEKNVKA